MTATIPDLKGFNTYYGLQVSDIGEAGAVIILGHHHNEPRRVIAALNKHARTFWGLPNLIDDKPAGPGELADSLVETYAVTVEHCDDYPNHAAGCFRCRELAAVDWWIEWNKPADAPGAFPVTVWEP